MKRFRRLLIWVGLPLVTILIIAVVLVGAMVRSLLDPAAIAARIEAEKNCRVALGGVDAKLLGGKIILHDLVLMPRDEHADAGTPLAERPEPVFNQTGIRVKRLALDAKLTDLLARRLTVRELALDELQVSYLIERDGSPSLDPLFDPPETVGGKPNERYEEEKKRRDLAKARRKMSPNDESRPEIDTFNVEELPIPATVERLRISDATVNIKRRKDKMRFQLSGIDLELDDLDIDPADLANHNRAHLEMECRLDIKDRDRTTTYADLALHARGDIKPFDPSTGSLNPDLITEVTLREGSKVFSLPLIEKLASTLDKLKKAGLDVSDLEDILIVNNDASTRLGWRDGVVRAVDPLAVTLNGHELVMDPGAWLHTGSNEHEINGDLTFSDKTSSSALGKANEVLVGLVGEELAVSVGELLFSPVTKGSRVYVPFVSSGDFSRPKVRPRVELVDLSDVLKSKAKDDALDLLQGLIQDRQGAGPPDATGR